MAPLHFGQHPSHDFPGQLVVHVSHGRPRLIQCGNLGNVAGMSVRTTDIGSPAPVDREEILLVSPRTGASEALADDGELLDPVGVHLLILQRQLRIVMLSGAGLNASALRYAAQEVRSCLGPGGQRLCYQTRRCPNVRRPSGPVRTVRPRPPGADVC
jgi:hypothetical protein